MGRRKIDIQPIMDERKRGITFKLRKKGLIKKAMELSILTGCKISLVVFDSENKLSEYNSHEDENMILKFFKVSHLPLDKMSNTDYQNLQSNPKKKEKKKSVKMQDEMPVQTPAFSQETWNQFTQPPLEEPMMPTSFYSNMMAMTDLPGYYAQQGGVVIPQQMYQEAPQYQMYHQGMDPNIQKYSMQEVKYVHEDVNEERKRSYEQEEPNIKKRRIEIQEQHNGYDEFYKNEYTKEEELRRISRDKAMALAQFIKTSNDHNVENAHEETFTMNVSSNGNQNVVQTNEYLQQYRGYM